MKPEYNDDGNNKDKDHQKETKEDRQKDEGEVEAVAPAAVLETTTADETLLDTVPAQASQIQADPEPVINQIAQKGVAENTDTVAAIQDTIQDEGTTHTAVSDAQLKESREPHQDAKDRDDQADQPKESEPISAKSSAGDGSKKQMQMMIPLRQSGKHSKRVCGKTGCLAGMM